MEQTSTTVPTTPVRPPTMPEEHLRAPKKKQRPVNTEQHIQMRRLSFNSGDSATSDSE